MFAKYSQVDMVVGDRSWLDRLLSDARLSTQRILCIGDSRFTSPGGAGIHLYRHLGRHSFIRYGHLPESPFKSVGYDDSSFIGGGHQLEAPNSDPGLAADTIPPQFFPTRIAVGGYGPIATFNFADTVVSGTQTYNSNMLNFDRTLAQSVVCRIFAMTEPGSTEISAAFVQNTGIAYFGSHALDVTTSMGLNAVKGTIKSQAITVPYLTSDPTLVALNFWPNGTAIVLGARWEHPTTHHGLVFQPVSKGGYQANSVMAFHSQCGPMLNMLGPSAGLIFFGANDFGNDVTAAQFKIDVQNLINGMRATLGDPTFPFMLCSDVYRTGLTTGQKNEQDQSAGVLSELAQANINCVFLNVARATVEIGLNEGNTWAHADGVHWTELGSACVAGAIVGLMFGSPPARIPRPNYIPLTDNTGGFNYLLALESSLPMTAGRAVVMTEADYQASNNKIQGSVQVVNGRWKGSVPVQTGQQYRVLFVGTDGVTKSSKTITL